MYGPPKPRRPITSDLRQEPGALAAHAGICAAICRKSAAKGWSCCVNYGKDEPGARSVALEITESGGNAIAVQADVADPSIPRSL